MSDNTNVTFTVKELFQQIQTRLDAIASGLDSKASAADVVALAGRVGTVERAVANTRAVDSYRRWIFGSIGIGLLGIVVAVIGLATR